MKKIQAIIIAILVFSVGILSAHNPNQINYIFGSEHGDHSLKVHFTPKGAIDLLLELKPELAEQEALQLSDYHMIFTDYFNKTILLTVDGKATSLNFKAADLNKHDATMAFELDGIKEDYDDFFLMISSFTEIYKRTKNFVSIPTSQGPRQFVLDKNTTICSGKSEVFSKAEVVVNTNRYMVWITMGLFLLFGAWFYFESDMKKETVHAYHKK